jgi:hypothetical protein
MSVAGLVVFAIGAIAPLIVAVRLRRLYSAEPALTIMAASRLSRIAVRGGTRRPPHRGRPR